MARLIQTYLNKLKNGGIIRSFAAVGKWCVCGIIPQDWIPRLMRRRHAFLSNELDRALASTVKHGPFRGFKFSKTSAWSLEDRASMLLGFYEKEVLSELQETAGSRRIFIDLGAADGYYGVGVLVSNMFQTSYCFEISEEGQQTITSNAELNGVSDRISVKGIANKDFYKNFTPDELCSCVILVDIEGAEFDLFDVDTFRAFANATIIIEIHDFLVEDGHKKLQHLKSIGGRTHELKEIVTGCRDLSAFTEVRKFSDYDRWLICSERRRQLPTWLRFDPSAPKAD